MTTATVPSTVIIENLNRYPEFLIEKFQASPVEQKSVQKALSKTFLMKAFEASIVQAQAENLLMTSAPEKLPFTEEFAAYLVR